MSDVFIGLLGQLEVRVGVRPVAIAGTKQRLLLAALALRSGQVVSTQELIDRLWGDEPPPSARTSVRNYVKRLRGGFRAADCLARPLIESASGGYHVSACCCCVDVDQFRRLRQAARSSPDPLRESSLLNAALGLWRGRPLGGLGPGRWVGEAALGLEEELLQAVERRCDLDIEHGDPGAASVESLRLLAHHPLRESLWQRLIRSLHHAGRSAEALNRYDEVRRLLADQLGVEPSRPLRALYQRILADGNRPYAGDSSVIVGAATYSLQKRYT